MKNKLIGIGILLVIACGCTENKSKKENKNTLVFCVPVTTDRDWYNSDNIAPLFEGLDVLDFPVSTDNPIVQQYFNQGLILAYGFNHAEAARSFYYAAKLDPNCAMAYWGYAYVLGPNYNAGMESDNYERAYEAIQKALELSTENCTAKEKALINALSKRYVKEPVEDRSKLDIAYSEAIESVYKAYPNDADIGTLYAESIMNLHPWDLWDKEGNPKEWTPNIIATLEQVIKINSRHAGAHHFYIHAVEASNKPERGLQSAQLYDEGLVPAAGHLLHMPSHIYIRTGDYHKGSLSNFRAIKADDSYVTACNAQGVYPLAYFPHNYHFLAATATLEGNSKWGIDAAMKVSEVTNKKIMKEPGWGTLQHYYSIPWYVLVKFGKWEKILEMENEFKSLAYPEAIQAYARGMAFLGLGKNEQAKNELSKLNTIAEDPSIKDINIWELNDAINLVKIAQLVLEAEILASEKNFEESINLLKEAVKMEDNLNYNEPPDWFFSVRHHLGAVQIEAENYEDAIQTLNEDLKIFPKNGWALHGLKLVYSNLNNVERVLEIEESLKVIWATADIELINARLK